MSKRGPALEFSDGGGIWLVHGKYHRIDGPAVEFSSASSWYIDDFRYEEDDFNRLISEVKAMPLVLRLVDDRWWVREFEEDNV